MNSWSKIAVIAAGTLLLGGLWDTGAPAPTSHAMTAKASGDSSLHGFERELITDLGSGISIGVTFVSSTGTVFYSGNRDNQRALYGVAGARNNWHREAEADMPYIIGEDSQGVVYVQHYTTNGYELFAYSSSSEARRIAHRPGMYGGHAQLLPDDRLLLYYPLDNGHHLVRLIERTGEEIWKRTFKELQGIQFMDGRLHVLDQRYGLFALDGQGQVVWRYGGQLESGASMILDQENNRLYLQQPEPYASRLTALDADSGAIQWERQTVPFTSLYLHDEGLQLIDQTTGDLYRFDRNGNYQWASLLRLEPVNIRGNGGYSGFVVALDGEMAYEAFGENLDPSVYRIGEQGRILGVFERDNHGSPGMTSFTEEGIYQWSGEQERLRFIDYDGQEIASYEGIPTMPWRGERGELYYGDGGKLYRLSLEGVLE